MYASYSKLSKELQNSINYDPNNILNVLNHKLQTA